MTDYYHVVGTVDDDELLSLRFGPALGEKVPSYVETQLCDTFWSGDMSVALINAFSRGNRTVDFKLTVDCGSPYKPTLMAVEADGWPLDARSIGKQLGLFSIVILCDHDLQRLTEAADKRRQVQSQEERHG